MVERTNTSKYSVTMSPQLSFHKNEQKQNSKVPINVLTRWTKAIRAKIRAGFPPKHTSGKNSRERANSVGNEFDEGGLYMGVD